MREWALFFGNHRDEEGKPVRVGGFDTRKEAVAWAMQHTELW